MFITHVFYSDILFHDKLTIKYVNNFRYNRLLKAVHQSSQDLLKALKGLVVMSQELENMSTSLFNNAVPALWAGKVESQLIDRL